MSDMILGSFHPADSEHPASKDRAPATDNIAPVQQQQQQQQQSPPGEKRRGSKGSGK